MSKDLKFKVIEVQETVPGSSSKRKKGFGFTETYFEVYFVSEGKPPLLCQEFSLRSPFGERPRATTIRETISSKMKFMFDLMATDKRLESSVFVELPAVYWNEIDDAIDSLEIPE